MTDFLSNPPLIEALAKLAGATSWPIVVLLLTAMFKTEISSFAKRIRTWTLFGNKFELTEDLENLAKAAGKARDEIYLPPEAPEQQHAREKAHAEEEKDTEKIISVASENPEFGLMLLARKIEEEMRLLLAMGGHHKGRRALSYRDMAEYLGKNAAVSENLRRSLELFWGVRNKIVHGQTAASPEDLIWTIDIGLTVLSAIRAIPRENNVVAHPGADMFSDPEGKQRIDGVKALILDTTAPGGAKKDRRVFPTTKTHFRVGMTVSWEWNRENTWDQCWYRDPWTSEIKSGWHSSAEFVGRDRAEI